MIEIIIIRLFENSSCVDTMISIKFFYIPVGGIKIIDKFI